MAIQRCALVLLLSVAMLGTPYAAAEKNVSSQTYEALTEIQKMMEEDRNEEAYSELDSLKDEVEADTIDEAVVLQMLGRLEAMRDNYGNAIKHFRKSYDSGKLPDDMESEIGRTLAQLYASEERYEEALGFTRDWIESLEKPEPRQLIFLANVLAQTERYDEARQYANDAIAASDDPKESWFQMLVSASFSQENYRQAAADLKRMIRRWPDKSRYWQQLANVNIELDDRDTALAVLQLAWKQGVLEKENSVNSLIQLAVNRGIPERGARFLDHALEEGIIPVEVDYVELLADAWLAGREYDSGISALERLADIKGKGDPYLRIANLHIDQGRWSEAEEALRAARERDLDEPGRAWVLLGIALTEQNRFDEGLDALRKGRAYEDSRQRADRWLKYAQQLKKQHNWKSRNQSQGA